MASTTAGEGLLQIALPPGTPEHTQVAVRRLIDVTATLARRCAQLQEALESRIVIEQAKGVLAERYRLEPDRAFEVLRRGARSSRLPLHELAARVVSSGQTPREVVAQLDGAAQRPRSTRKAGSR